MKVTEDAIITITRINFGWLSSVPDFVWHAAKGAEIGERECTVKGSVNEHITEDCN